MLLVLVPVASSDNGVDSSQLRTAVNSSGIVNHMAALQAIADANGGTRVAGAGGYDASAEYVYGKLAAAGYNPSYQEFTFSYFQELAPSVLEQVAPNAVTYTWNVDFLTMEYSPSGDVTADVQAVDLLIPPVGGSTSGCEAADFAGFTPGRIALIQRGTCTFFEKAQNAQAAGAVGVIIFNEGNTPDRTPLFGGTLGGLGISIPVLSTSYALGETLAGLSADGLVMHLATYTLTEPRTTRNVIANSPAGRTDRVVLVGAHLDSVPAGPGINDNGSGSSMILEIALQMAQAGIKPRNQVRFAFWSAEEEGLVGSTYYVSQLPARDIKNIAANLNFDMVASPNFVRFVYDGDGSATPLAGPNGSRRSSRFSWSTSQPKSAGGAKQRSMALRLRALHRCRNPGGGLFTGAEEFKTSEQAAVYGGTAGLALDPCYHQALRHSGQPQRPRIGPDGRCGIARCAHLRHDLVCC